MRRFSVVVLAGYMLVSVLPARNCRADSQASIVTPAEPSGDRQGPLLAVTEENDLFSNPITADHTDRHYTQGLKLTWLNGDNELPPWARTVSDDLPKLGLGMTAQNFGYVLGQNMYTPANLQTNALITNDRPYAGWLYGGAFLQRRGEVGDARIPVQESFEADFGTTGPGSLAGWIQTHFHQTFDSASVPHGWKNQLSGEPGLLLKYQRFWRLSPDAATARYLDLIPHMGGELGNIMIFQNLGGILRVGYNLPDDFGPQLIDSPASLGGGTTSNSSPFACYLFGGVDGRAVEHNLFLDGNSFRSGPSVERIPWVADLSTGGAVRLFGHVEISYTRVTRTHEFVGQRRADQFGSLEAKAMFLF
ncbi:MAG TPA: lipid A deacylase LpxR family protein [Verrucomicrobiae bacterium]|nr:lipid A deacylase LpxR family protein [Verrucomicrobiae bacterium]